MGKAKDLMAAVAAAHEEIREVIFDLGVPLPTKEAAEAACDIIAIQAEYHRAMGMIARGVDQEDWGDDEPQEVAKPTVRARDRLKGMAAFHRSMLHFCTIQGQIPSVGTWQDTWQNLFTAEAEYHNNQLKIIMELRLVEQKAEGDL